MLSILKRLRLGWITPAAPIIVTDEGSTVERVAQVPQDVFKVDKMELEEATAEWASAVSDLRQAQAHFDSADREYVDTAIMALKLAHMRADLAHRRVRKLAGLDVRAVGA